tara:strand:- start:372 stop:566 length:195 start_codon:yes stop_codon:yes gene_type:complete
VVVTELVDPTYPLQDLQVLVVVVVEVPVITPILGMLVPQAIHLQLVQHKDLPVVQVLQMVVLRG